MLKFGLLLALICAIQSYELTRDEGYGNHYVLHPTQDVWLEGRSNKNRNSINQLIVGNLVGFPLKRSLIQFENLPSSCTADKIIWARMQLYFLAAHRASFRSVEQQPWLDYTLNVHRVKKYWREDQATAYQRYSGRGGDWAATYLKLGDDAEAQPQYNPTTIYSREPRAYKGFDVTGAARSWAEGQTNYGLLIKVVRENVYARGLRFYDRHHPNKNFRPFLQVLCKN